MVYCFYYVLIVITCGVAGAGLADEIRKKGISKAILLRGGNITTVNLQQGAQNRFRRQMPYGYQGLGTQTGALLGSMSRNYNPFINHPRYTPEQIEVRVYYETLCPDVRNFFIKQLTNVIHKLGSRIRLYTFPYGKAYTNLSPNGTLIFNCQHGEEEAYGNKLHACALHYLADRRYTAELYNICLLDFSHSNKGSDDRAADVCGNVLHVNPENIKKCAKSSLGSNLLHYHGSQTQLVPLSNVPFILVNGQVYEGKDLYNDLLSLFRERPSMGPR